MTDRDAKQWRKFSEKKNLKKRKASDVDEQWISYSLLVAGGESEAKNRKEKME